MANHSFILSKFYEYKRDKDDSMSFTSTVHLDKVLREYKDSLARKILHKESPAPVVRKTPHTAPEEPLFPPECAIPPQEENYKKCITLELLSKDDLLLKMSIFSAGPLKEAVQRSAGIYCKEYSGWVLPVRMYRDFKYHIKRIPGVHMKEVPEFVVRALASPIPSNTSKFQ